MNLNTKRCGCGAIYTPAVRTQTHCETCTQTRLAAQRGQVYAAALKLPAGRSCDVRRAWPVRSVVFQRRLSPEEREAVKICITHAVQLDAYTLMGPSIIFSQPIGYTPFTELGGAGERPMRSREKE